MKFSYTATWEDAMALLRAHAPLVVAVAGVFILLPALAAAYFLPLAEPSSLEEYVRALREYFDVNWPWLLLLNLVHMVGAAAILLLVFPRRAGTLGQTIAAAVMLLPFYFAASFLSSLAIGFGLILFIVPGLYLFGRLAPTSVAVVAEDIRNPLNAVRRAWDLTRGRGWAVLAFLVVVGVAAYVLTLVVNMLAGLLLVLVAGKDLGTSLAALVSAATGAVVSTLMVLIFAALYRQLAAVAPTPSATTGS